MVGRPHESLKLDSIPSAMVLTNDNRYILIASLSTNKVTVVDVLSNTVIKEISVGKLPSGIVIDRIRNKAYVANKFSSS